MSLFSGRVEIRSAHKGDKPAGNRPLVLRLSGANEHAAPRGEGQLPAKGNYFIGNDRTRWRTNISTYRKVRYDGVYPGVDVVYYGKQHELEYDFVIAPGASPRIISWQLDGARDVKLSASGELTASLAGGERIVQHTPFAYQEIAGVRVQVASRYAFRADGNIGVELASYDTRYPLVVDPVLSYSTYIGGSMDDRASGVAVDANGNVYVIGDATFASNAPGTFGQDRDVFLWKFDPTGTNLLYYAVFGGTYNENGNAIAVDAAGNAYIAGSTSSSNIPTTANAYSMVALKTPDAFLAKIDTTQPVASSLVFSTHFPADDARGVAVDGTGKVYLTGQASWNFVTTAGAFQRTCSTCSYTHDAFVAKFDLSRSGAATLVYSTYLGGSSVPILGSADDVGYAIAVNAQGEATVAGSASSLDFPLQNAVQTTYQGGTVDGFVTRLNATGSGLIYSTFLGTAETDWATAIALDAQGNAYITGLTNWNGFPVTSGAFQPAWHLNQCGNVNYYAPCADAFVTKLNNTGQLVYSTYLGGNLSDYGYGIAVDAAGSAYVTGYALSYDFPTLNPIAGAGHSANDAFLVKLNPQGTGILFSSYLGGTGHDEGLSIAVFNGDAFVAGKTDATDFPVLNAVQPASAGANDGFLLKITGFSAAASSLSSIAVNPSNVPAGTPSAGTITLSSAAPANGATVTLTSSDTNAATVPATAVVPAGATSVTFAVTSKPVTAATPVTISGSYAGVTKTAVLTVSPAAALSTLTVAPATVIGPAPATGTIRLTAASSTAINVTLASSNASAAAVPASVNVPAGATTATFTITTHTVTAATAVTISATHAGVTKTAVLTVSPALNAVTLSPAQVIGSISSTGTVKLSSAAPAGGAQIALTSSNTAAATVPASVTVAAGALSATFTVSTHAVNAATVVAISAAYNGAAKSANLTVQPALASVALSPVTVIAPNPANGTVKLTLAAPAGGMVVSLSSGNTAAATVPASVTVAAGATSATFTVTTKPVSAQATAAIAAAAMGVTKQVVLTVKPPFALAISPNPVIGSKNATGTVTLTAAAPAGGTAIALTSSNPAVATAPASVTVAAGATTATFVVTTQSVAAATSIVLSAASNGYTVTKTLTVNPPALSAITTTPVTVVGGTASTGKITLSAVAPAAGMAVTLTSSNPATAHVPATVTVPAGSLSATFPITTTSVAANTTATLTATQGGVVKTTTLTVTP